MKKYLKQLKVIWTYSHEYLLLGELSQGVLVKYKIPTPNKMVQTNRDIERKRDGIKKIKSIIVWNTCASSSSISLYNIEAENEDIACASSENPSFIREITPPLDQGEEMDSSHATVKIPLEKHFSNNSVVPKQEGPSRYNIEEVFCSFTFDLHWREVIRRKFRKVKEDDGIMWHINEDEVLFERIDEYPMLVAIALVALSQANILKVSLLHEIQIEEESEKK